MKLVTYFSSRDFFCVFISVFYFVFYFFYSSIISGPLSYGPCSVSFTLRIRIRLRTESILRERTENGIHSKPDQNSLRNSIRRLAGLKGCGEEAVPAI